MSKENNRYFTITDEFNKTTEYEILFTFNSEETNKNYIVFTNNKKDKEGNIITYAANYKQNGEKLELEDIKSESEWSLIENILSQIEDKIEE